MDHVSGFAARVQGVRQWDNVSDQIEGSCALSEVIINPLGSYPQIAFRQVDRHVSPFLSAVRLDGGEDIVSYWRVARVSGSWSSSATFYE